MRAASLRFRFSLSISLCRAAHTPPHFDLTFIVLERLFHSTELYSNFVLSGYRFASRLSLMNYYVIVYSIISFARPPPAAASATHSNEKAAAFCQRTARGWRSLCIDPLLYSSCALASVSYILRLAVNGMAATGSIIRTSRSAQYSIHKYM